MGAFSLIVVINLLNRFRMFHDPSHPTNSPDASPNRERLIALNGSLKAKTSPPLINFKIKTSRIGGSSNRLVTVNPDSPSIETNRNLNASLNSEAAFSDNAVIVRPLAVKIDNNREYRTPPQMSPVNEIEVKRVQDDIDSEKKKEHRRRSRSRSNRKSDTLKHRSGMSRSRSHSRRRNISKKRSRSRDRRKRSRTRSGKRDKPSRKERRRSRSMERQEDYDDYERPQKTSKSKENKQKNEEREKSSSVKERKSHKSSKRERKTSPAPEQSLNLLSFEEPMEENETMVVSKSSKKAKKSSKR